jgi:hypothetical protein
MIAGPTAAAPPPAAGTRAQALQSLTDCRKLTDNAARLACYDTAAAGLEQAEAKGDIVVVDREQAHNVRRQAFGFALPSLTIFDRGEKPEAIDAVTLPVKSAARGADGKWVIRFDGQAWRQIDTGDFSREPKAGMAATIRSAMFGSFIMSIGGHAGVRVKRTD